MLTLLRICDSICDPAWVAVLFAFLASYEQMQEGALEVRRDLRETLSELWGLLKKCMHPFILAGRRTLRRLADQRTERHIKMGKEIQEDC